MYKEKTLDQEYKFFQYFVHTVGTSGEKAIQICEYHIAPRPCK